MGKRSIWLAVLVAVSGCGAKTGLPSDPFVSDGGPAPIDAAIEDSPDAFDARSDAIVIDCEEAGITYIYLISEETHLLRFDPPSREFTTIGSIQCPTTTRATPFSMAVDRLGIAYVLYDSGELFRVSTLTASCQPTRFVAGQRGFPTNFGMGFSSNGIDSGETLFVVGSTIDTGAERNTLGTIDPTAWELTPIGDLDPPIGDAELTGTGDNRLFGFVPSPNAAIAEISKSDARVLNPVPLDMNQGLTEAWAFAFWGGDFYIFTSMSNGSSTVHRFTPGGSATPEVYATTNVTIVGAGVSTCAPHR